MNDVKVTSQDFALKQVTSSSQIPPSAESNSSQVETDPVAAVQAQQVQQAGQAESVENVVTQLNDFVQTVQRDLQFRLDDDSGKTVITVLDRKTEEVVRQIPNEVALELARNLQQDEPISLINAKV